MVVMSLKESQRFGDHDAIQASGARLDCTSKTKHGDKRTSGWRRRSHPSSSPPTRRRVRRWYKKYGYVRGSMPRRETRLIAEACLPKRNASPASRHAWAIELLDPGTHRQHDQW
ncbi:hypothetical protein V3481_007394 [Fusarium oxysporum f. sp. vasinfectum]